MSGQGISSDFHAQKQENEEEFKKWQTIGILLWVCGIIGTCCIIACIGGCIYYCIKQNQNQRTATMAQHQAVYQPGGMAAQTTAYSYTTATTGSSSGSEANPKHFGTRNAV